jgi:hypothetical protein
VDYRIIRVNKISEKEKKIMKINVRFVVVAVVLACIAGLGFSRGAWAGPLMQGTVPSCDSSLTGYVSLTTCNSTVTSQGGDVTVTDIPLPEDDFPPIPGSKNSGPAVLVEGNGNLVEICFPDIDVPPVGNIFRWMSPADWLKEYNAVEAGRWVYQPTYHKATGLTCTMSWDSGIYTIEY